MEASQVTIPTHLNFKITSSCNGHPLQANYTVLSNSCPTSMDAGQLIVANPFKTN
jgi:hypothetical protein